ncbi:MAG TPA: hypothetical protein PK251_14905 [Candidatus Latescibacteria bacterium]|nr:hypothetical protein [Candidatus Latescibacterota bacterium]HOS66027.1 hypothetical protein [Candidatus Latescibacterota bacterium]HRT28349.1 hypothetical protein [Kiritimatiellia bacterium]
MKETVLQGKPHLYAVALLMFFGLACACARAETVALWPLDYDALSPANGGRCAVSAANDLSCIANNGGGKATDAYGIGWNLPPNPDTTEGLRFDPVNCSYARAKGGVRYIWTNPTAGLLVAPQRDFTVEFFFRLDSLPSYFYALFSVFWNLSGNDNDRWMLMLKSGPETGGYSFQCYCGNPDIRTNSADYVFYEVPPAEAATFLVDWHHVAITHKIDTAAGTTTWKFYLNGALKNTRTIAALPTARSASAVDNALAIGGRNVADGYQVNGSVEYCRISDEALEPEDFLNYGGDGTVQTVANDSTVAYWPHGISASGGFNSRIAAGYAILDGGFLDQRFDEYLPRRGITVSEDRAFEGYPPNTATSLKPADENNGSIYLPAQTSACSMASSYLVINDLAKEITITNDFTVEGWFKPEIIREGSMNVWTVVFGSRTSIGWQLQYYASSNADTAPYYCVHVEDADGRGIAAIDATAWGAPRFGEWEHLALVYDADGGSGHGEWKLYRNGTLANAIANARAINKATVFPSSFFLYAGAANTWQGSCGKWDNVRVCKAALAPDQLLCATTGARDATDVIAYWPMNNQKGLYIDGTDLTGNYTFHGKRGDTDLLAVSDDTPPQADLPAGSGSVCFNCEGAGSKAYLYSGSQNLYDLLRSDAWTYEFWMKRSDANTAWQVLLYTTTANFSSLVPGWGNGIINFTYRPANDKGFNLWANGIVPGLNDAYFTGADGAYVTVPVGEWVHVALEFEKKDDTGTFSLFTNGVYAAKLSGAFGAYSSPGHLNIGGRHQGNGFRGKMAGFRFSKRALASGEFLCNRTTNVATKAYWPIDNDNGALALESRVGFLNDLGVLSAETSYGVEDGARRGLLKVDPYVVNSGSASLTDAGRLGTGMLADSSYIGGAFTVEGWYRCGTLRANDASQTIVGNAESATSGGWRLSADTTVTPTRFRLKVVPPRGFRTSPLDATFDCAVPTDDWHHIALEYNPLAGESRGEWTLFIDGSHAASLTNAFNPSDCIGPDAFHLGGVGGAATAAGEYDMWRVTRGLLTAGELLYCYREGLLIRLK